MVVILAPDRKQSNADQGSDKKDTVVQPNTHNLAIQAQLGSRLIAMTTKPHHHQHLIPLVTAIVITIAVAVAVASTLLAPGAVALLLPLIELLSLVLAAALSILPICVIAALLLALLGVLVVILPLVLAVAVSILPICVIAAFLLAFLGVLVVILPLVLAVATSVLPIRARVIAALRRLVVTSGKVVGVVPCLEAKIFGLRVREGAHRERA